MKKAGGILLAKTNLPEFSYWIESDNLLTGRSNNPWDLTRTPGGSSGGESAAIAAGMSPIGLGTDLAISVRGPAAQTGIVSLKATHGRVPMTGIWPRVPRRFWHVGPMARTIRDLALAFSQLAGPDGQDGFATSTVQFDAGIGRAPDRQLRVGWMVGPGFGPVDPEVAATVKAAADALKGIGVFVEPVAHPGARARLRPRRVQSPPRDGDEAGVRGGDGRSRRARCTRWPRPCCRCPTRRWRTTSMPSRRPSGSATAMPTTSQRYDALITHVLPIPAHKHGVAEFTINGQTVDATYLQGATVPLNVTGLPGVSMRFGTSKEGLADQRADRRQLAGRVDHPACRLAAGGVSPVRGLHPSI